MNKQTTDIIKIVVGILIGTLLVVGAMWFMAGGVMFLPIFVVIPVLIVLFAISIVVVSFGIGTKYMPSVIGAFIFGWFGFNALYKHTCGPNSADVKVMKPMAEKISDYIVKHGIPESLKDIPDLPYGLEGCRKETTYGNPIRTYFIEGAQWKENMEICNFENITIRFRLAKSLKEKNSKWDGSLRMSSSHETTLYSSIEQDKDNKFIFNDIRFSGKRSGICKPWRP